MNTTLYAVRKFLAMLFVGVLFFGVQPNGAPAHTVLDEDNCRLNAFVASDAHIEGNQFERLTNFGRMLYDIKNTKRGNDAIVFLGDNTMNGQHIENMLFFGALTKVSPAENTLVMLGNHDVGNGAGSFKELSDRYMAYNSIFLDEKLEKPFRFKIINGYYFIMLSTESSTSNEMDISDEQLTFLRETMDAATADGKPVFVFNHYPLDWEIGDKQYAISSLLGEYKNVFYFYGHMHSALNISSITKYKNIRCISVPMFTSINKEDTTGEDTGVGFALEVYDDSVAVRARDCYDGKWLDNYSFSFPLD